MDILSLLLKEFIKCKTFPYCPSTCITGRTVKELGVDESIIASKFPYLLSEVGLLRIHHFSNEVDIVIDNKWGLFRSLTLQTLAVN